MSEATDRRVVRADAVSRQVGSVGRGLVLILALVLAAAPLDLLIDERRWLPLMALAAVVVVGSGILLRALRLAPVLVPLGQALLALALLIGVEANESVLPPGGPLGLILGQEDVLAGGIIQLGQSFPPVRLVGRASVVVVLLLCLVALALDLLFVDLERGTPAGLVLTSFVLVPTLMVPEGGPWWTVAGPLTGALLVFAARPGVLPGAGRPIAPTGRRGAIAGIGAVLVALVVTLGPALAAALPLQRRAPYPLSIESLRSGTDGVSDLGPVMIADSVSVRRDLVRGREREVLRYTTDADDPSYLRLRVLTDYRDGTFLPGGTEAGISSFSDAVLEGDPPAGASTYHVTLEDLASDRLPAPQNVRGVSTAVQLSDTGRAEGELRLIGGARSLSGVQYQVASEPSTATADQLRAVTPEQTSVQFSSGAVQVQAPGEVSRLARQVQAEAGVSSAFDTARAFEEYFHANFTYDLTARTPEGEDPVTSFLRERTGYCEQYAATFALMMDSLGYPTRVAIGFTAGTAEGSGRDEAYVVTNHNAHAWPEVWFGEQYGWIRFEPTPAADAANGVEAADRPASTASSTAAAADPTATASTQKATSAAAATPTGGATTSPRASTSAASPSSATSDPGSAPTVPLAVAAGGIALLGGALLLRARDRGVRAARERRWEQTATGRSGSHGSAEAPGSDADPVSDAALLAWREIEEALRCRARRVRVLGFTGRWGRPARPLALDPVAPPRAALAALLGDADRAGIPVDAADQEAAELLAEAVTRARYAPGGGGTAAPASRERALALRRAADRILRLLRAPARRRR